MINFDKPDYKTLRYDCNFGNKVLVIYFLTTRFGSFEKDAGERPR